MSDPGRCIASSQNSLHFPCDAEDIAMSVLSIEGRDGVQVTVSFFVSPIKLVITATTLILNQMKLIHETGYLQWLINKGHDFKAAVWLTICAFEDVEYFDLIDAYEHMWNGGNKS